MRLLPKHPKYRNQKTTVDGIVFDSKKEAARWAELRLMALAGEIYQLERQRPFILAPSVILNGRKKPALKYVSDFSYMQGDHLVVEDTKSEVTRKLPVYRVKAHLLKSTHGIDIKEI